MSVSEVLESIRRHSTSERDKGDRFERLILEAFRVDRTYRERFTDVWLWMDWPDRGNEPDTGIDLVAKHADGGYTAIQCKFYAPDHTLVKADIDSFFTASGREPFTDRIIVATTDFWSHNAEKSLARQKIPVTRVGVDDLDAMTIDWSQYDAKHLTALVETARKRLWTHQSTAVEKVRAGFGESDRGKLIMACGTGKTFTALRVAEEHAGAGKAVLFLAPSIALVSQSLKEWTAECEVPIRPFAVCSDATAGKPIEGENATPYDLSIPPTTSLEALIEARLGEMPADEMTVVFSTYQSIQVVADVQAVTGLVFDLVVCDEAHRTTGVSGMGDEEDSAFVKVHDNSVVPARRRLYMTATPRIYKPAAKVDAAENDLLLASMDDPETYGPEFHRLGFGEAVELGLLADYKVLILTVEEEAISQSFQSLLSQNGELKLPDVAKFIGCLTGLAKLPSASGRGGFTGQEPPMQRAVAFWSSIKESERFADMFSLVADHYNRQRVVEADLDAPEVRQLSVPTRHVDGTDNIRSRRTDIRWLKDTPPDNECRVLTNAKCLTEGVDVPALDAVMFLKPRRSKIDIVQAVGRVMRKPPGKTMGYIILPIAIPAGEDPSTALNKNTDYDVVWDVLQALRSHDERFNAYINRIALLSDEPGTDPDGPIEIIDANPPDTAGDDEAATEEDEGGMQGPLFTFEEWTGAIYTKIVNKVGTRTYWEDWAHDVADMAARHTTRIEAILRNEPAVADEFATFLTGLRANLNDSISPDDAISMLSQHLITRPIFEALFGSDTFTINNPVSQAMQGMVDILDQHNLDTETETLDKFYDSVRRRVESIPPHDADARQRIIKDLYGRFFAIAFPKVADSLGIVYTPIEVVDFILRATEAALNEHFDGASLTDPGVHILDPFTGTGTFITRLLQTGLIRPHDLARKYTEEIHANEILLLAYYIAAVNIESTFLQQRDHHGTDAALEPFPGIVLTDTFQLGETGEGTGTIDVFPINNERATRQRGLDIRVVIGNPPWSAAQSSENDNNANLSYPTLDKNIAATYRRQSSKQFARQSLYDSYVRAIRWASDRVQNSLPGGVIAVVTNGGFIDNTGFDGFRKTLGDEFHHVYIYNLRGNARTAGERRRMEAGNVFESGSRATVAVMLLVKQPGPVGDEGAQIYYRDIGDYLTRDQKLTILDSNLRPAGGATPSLHAITWSRIEPNEHGDWINQRSDTFAALTPLSPSEHDPEGVFRMRSNGLKTNRDPWNYNASREKVAQHTGEMVEFFNSEVDRFQRANPAPNTGFRERREVAKNFVNLDPTQLSWNHDDFARLIKGTHYELDDHAIVTSTYRPFHRQFVNFQPELNRTVGSLKSYFPPNAPGPNLAICVSGKGARAPFSALMVKDVPCMHLWIDDVLCYPRYVYDKPVDDSDAIRLFSPQERGWRAMDGLSDEIVSAWAETLGADITSDDAFYYVYGLLHSSDYRSDFAADLKKQAPRVPLVKTASDFAAFVKAGRELSRLHTEYEHVEQWPGLDVTYAPTFDASCTDAYGIEKMRYLKANDPDNPTGRKIEDKTTIIYNPHITVSGIPERAYEYRLGARSAIDWILESYRIKTDKASGIVNDPNDWATEHNNPTYIFDLIGRVVTVSMRTLDIIDQLPTLAL